MENNRFPSSLNLNKINRNLMLFQKIYYSPKKNILYNHFDNCHNFGLNKQRKNENLPKPKKGIIIPIVNNNKNEINEINEINNNSNNIKKFFTDYGGYGYKCSCSKTNCNRYYCECI